LDEPVSLELERLPRQTLHHAWAPKLGRLIVLSSVGQLWLWGTSINLGQPSWWRP